MEAPAHSYWGNLPLNFCLWRRETWKCNSKETIIITPGKGGDPVGVGNVVGIIDDESWVTVDVSIFRVISILLGSS